MESSGIGSAVFELNDGASGSDGKSAMDKTSLQTCRSIEQVVVAEADEKGSALHAPIDGGFWGWSAVAGS